MRVLVVGGSKGTGAAVVAELAERGHVVTSYARSAGSEGALPDGVRHVAGDVLDAEALGKAMVGQDAVVVTLGIPDNPFRVRLTRRASCAETLCGEGTAPEMARTTAATKPTSRSSVSRGSPKPTRASSMTVCGRVSRAAGNIAAGKRKREEPAALAAISPK